MATGDVAPRTAAVVGGGPAGLMAAEVFAAAGLEVTVYEHKMSVGVKLLLAGRGGLNITHSEPLDDLLDRYGAAREGLQAAIESFTPDDLRSWCDGLGEPTFVGTSGRVFPESFRATPLLRAWTRRLSETGVRFELGFRWTGWEWGAWGEPLPDRADAPRRLTFDRSARGQPAQQLVPSVGADVGFFGLGGASWPRTGSDGGWVDLFLDAGITVRRLQPANCGLVVSWSDVFAARFDGQPVKNCSVTVAGETARGDLMITSGGLEGGPAYAHSGGVRSDIAESGSGSIVIDLQPDLDLPQLTARLEQRRRPKDSTSTWLRRAGFESVGVGLMREATNNVLPTQPAALARLAKGAPIEVSRTMPIHRAISSAGGITFDELDDRFMVSKLPGVFVAGEMLDWEAPTGGYLLQATFSTAVAAANGAVAWLDEQD